MGGGVTGILKICINEAIYLVRAEIDVLAAWPCLRHLLRLPGRLRMSALRVQMLRLRTGKKAGGKWCFELRRRRSATRRLAALNTASRPCLSVQW